MDKVKIKVFAGLNTLDVERAVNDFIANRNIIEIKYQSVFAPLSYDTAGRVAEATVFDRILVVYEADK